MRNKNMQNIALVFAVVFFVLALACNSMAWDVSGNGFTNATAITVDLSDRYASGPWTYTQVTIWTDTDGTDSTNATFSVSPYGTAEYDAVKVTFVDGTAAATSATTISNATSPVVFGFEGVAFDGFKFTPADGSATTTLYYKITGW